MDISEHDFSQFLTALKFSADKHRKQRRKDGETPYINHPIQVTELLWRVGGIHDITILVAALLHDVIEDTQTSPDEIREKFGQEVLSIVLEVSDDKSQPKAERKQHQIEEAPHLSTQATQIKLADKISNIYSITHVPPVDWSIERKKQYLDWGEKVVQGMQGTNPALKALFDETLAEGRRLLAQEEAC